MTKRELIKAIRKGRAEFEVALAGLTPEQMTARGAEGGWSVKDTLGHVAVWESRLVTILYSIERGVAPKVIRAAEVDKFNAESLAEQRDRPLERVLADFHAVHAQLLKRLEAVPERDLFDPSRFGWMEGEPLARMVAGDTFEHYAEHRPAIEAWRSQGRV
jgi:uncharacterized protein (TIGR03083 family)